MNGIDRILRHSRITLRNYAPISTPPFPILFINSICNRKCEQQGPDLEQYRQLYDYVCRLGATREEGRYGATVEPMLQWAKSRTAAAPTQVVPCRAGVLNAVVYSNDDVSVCENHEPLGNLGERTFGEIWNSPEADALRKSIAAKACYCTNEVFLWPSITFRPVQLVRAMAGAKVWRGVEPLSASESVRVATDEQALAGDRERLIGIQTSVGKS